MNSFSSICIVWISFCVGLVSVQTVITVSGSVGSKVVLPCELKSPDTESPHIRWKIDSKIVFERRGKDSYQDEGYEDRLDVPENKLNNGNCSLLLKNLTLNDAAEYESYQIVRRSKRDTKNVPISRVILTVREKPEEKSSDGAPPPSGAAGMKSPHTLSTLLSLLSSFLFHFLLQHTRV